MIRNSLSIATSSDQPIEDGIATFFEPAVESIRELGQISVEMFARDVRMGPSDPCFQPRYDPMNIREDLNCLLTLPTGEG